MAKIKPAHEVSTPQELKDFWRGYEGLTLLEIQKEWVNGDEVTEHFIEVIASFVGQDEYVTTMIRSFCPDDRNLEQAMRCIDLINRRLNVDSGDARRKLGEIRRYLKLFIVQTAPSSLSLDGGENWLVFTEDEFKEAEEYLESVGQLVCGRTIKSYLIKKRTGEK